VSAVRLTIRSVALKVTYAGLGVGAAALQPALAVRRRAIDGLGHVTVVLVDGALASSYADEAVRHMLESELAERAVARAVAGDLVDVAARDLVRAGVLERVAAQVVDGPELERLLQQALDSAAVERMVAQVVGSPVVRDAVARVADDVVDRMRSSESLWSLIDDIAQSPQLAEAITRQGAGFADQVGDELRERSRSADERLERAASRLWRRRPRPDPALPTGAA
jgi:hypothetical protein